MERERSLSWIPILTIRGFILGSLLLAPPLVGLATGRRFAETLVLSGALLLIAGIYIIVDFLRIRSILNSLSIRGDPPRKLHSEDPTALIYEVDAQNTTLAFSLSLAPNHPGYCRTVDDRYELTFDRQTTVLKVEHRFTALSRGAISFSPLSVRISGLWSMFAWQAQYQVAECENLRVLPNPFFGKASSTFVLRPLLNGQTLMRMNGADGREFDSLRPYSRGDDIRRIDWKRSAKRDSTVVRVYRPETHQRVLIFLDCSRKMGNRVDSRLQLDFACDAVASLSRIAIEQHDEVGVFAFSHRPLRSVNIGGGPRQVERILESMVDLSSEHLDPDYSLITRWAHASRRRALLVVVTSIMNPATIDSIARALKPTLGRHLPLLVAISDRDLERLSLQPVTGIEDAYETAAASEQLGVISDGSRLLQRMGIETIYTDAKLIGSQLGERYVKLKQQGRM